MSDSKGSFLFSINCALCTASTLNNSETMRSEKYFLSSKGPSAPLKHIQAVKSKSVWDHENIFKEDFCIHTVFKYLVQT